jgi:hypothetical protein
MFHGRNINIFASHMITIEIWDLQKVAVVSQLKGYCPIHQEQLISSPYENQESDFCPKCEAEWMHEWQTDLDIRIAKAART